MKRLVCAAFAASLLVTTASFAMGPTPHTSESRSKAISGLSKDVIPALQAAQKAAQAGDMAGAMAQIRIAQAVPNLNEHDQYAIAQLLSAIAANMRDYPTAMTAYDTMIASPDFATQDPADQKLAVHDAVVVAQNVQQWPKVISYGQQLETLGGNDEITYTVIAIAYYSQKDNKTATVYAQKAVDYAKANNKTAPEQAMQLVTNGLAQSDPAAALRNMEQIAIDHNEPDLWYKLTDHAVGARGVKEIDALYLYRLRFMAGGMEQGDDYLVMTSLAELLGYSTEEVKVFEQGMSSGKLSAGQAGAKLSKARKDAATDERLLPTLAASADKAKSGDQSVKLAEDYWGYGRYADAETMARAGIAKGYPKDPTEGQMILGEALVAQGKYDEAIATFNAVSGNDGRKSAAHLWSIYAQARKKQGH
jgi:tetratricopeptide (TPR) repeat protein